MTKQILYIEDNSDSRTLVRRVLQSEGYVVREAPDGRTGLQMAAEQRPDLVLMDINLPEVDGYEVTARLKQLAGMSQVPVIAVTANVMKGDREKTLAAGCDGYIQKPIDIDTLSNQIEHFLTRNNS
ncbi:MAG TPA: response regulator [Anaerolineae bacterium]|jgi:two-component system cell cycle response regulator DivK|nr:response regulator [Anaerolineae bacterium]